MRRIFIGLCLGLLTCLSAPLVLAQSVGQAVSVTQGAQITVDGRSRNLAKRDQIPLGAVISTNATGQAQIVFADRTRIAIGPSSRLEIESILLKSQDRASRFAVTAAGGTFRFLSGKSPKSAYQLRTPTATMGIRGTEFDFTVDGREVTDLVTFRGRVEICANNRSCARVSGGCATVATDRRGRVLQPANKEEKAIRLFNRFPFIVSQDSLQREFRTRTWSCGDISSIALQATQPKKKKKKRFDRKASIEERSDSPAQSESYNELADERE